MMQKWMQNDENEDRQTELGVEDGGVRKKRRGGNNASKWTTRSSSPTAGSVVDGNVCDNDRGGEGSANRFSTTSVLEEPGGGPSDRGDGNISNDDDDPVELWGEQWNASIQRLSICWRRT